MGLLEGGLGVGEGEKRVGGSGIYTTVGEEIAMLCYAMLGWGVGGEICIRGWMVNKFYPSF